MPAQQGDEVDVGTGVERHEARRVDGAVLEFDLDADALAGFVRFGDLGAGDGDAGVGPVEFEPAAPRRAEFFGTRSLAARDRDERFVAFAGLDAAFVGRRHALAFEVRGAWPRAARPGRGPTRCAACTRSVRRARLRRRRTVQGW